GADVPDGAEGVQEPASCRTRQPGAPGDVAQRQTRMLGVERTDHRQATVERLHVARRSARGCLTGVHAAHLGHSCPISYPTYASASAVECARDPTTLRNCATWTRRSNASSPKRWSIVVIHHEKYSTRQT